jgi:hypothetical protein
LELLAKPYRCKIVNKLTSVKNGSLWHRQFLSKCDQQLGTLELEELQQLNQAIQKYLQDQQAAAQRAKFHKVLLTSGLVKQLKSPSCYRQTERELIQVQGKPVSETIIEEPR